VHAFKEGQSKKQQGPKWWFEQKQPMAFVERNKSSPPLQNAMNLVMAMVRKG